MFTKEFWMDTAERALYTMAEVAIPLVSVMSTDGVVMDWKYAATVIVGSGLVCVLKCIVKVGSAKQET